MRSVILLVSICFAFNGMCPSSFAMGSKQQASSPSVQAVAPVVVEQPVVQQSIFCSGGGYTVVIRGGDQPSDQQQVLITSEGRSKLLDQPFQESISKKGKKLSRIAFVDLLESFLGSDISRKDSSGQGFPVMAETLQFPVRTDAQKVGAVFGSLLNDLPIQNFSLEINWLNGDSVALSTLNLRLKNTYVSPSVPVRCMLMSEDQIPASTKATFESRTKQAKLIMDLYNMNDQARYRCLLAHNEVNPLFVDGNRPVTSKADLQKSLDLATKACREEYNKEKVALIRAFGL